VPDEDPEACGHAREESDHVHAGHHPHHHTLADKSARQPFLGWRGDGLTLHTLIDGIALAASVQAEAHSGSRGWLLGLGTFLVIILHKPFDAMAITTLMAAGGSPPKHQLWANGLFALTVPLGVILFQFGAGYWVEHQPVVLGRRWRFARDFCVHRQQRPAAGTAISSHDRVKLSAAMLAGLCLSILIGRLETSGHENHRHGPAGVRRQQKRFGKDCKPNSVCPAPLARAGGENHLSQRPVPGIRSAMANLERAAPGFPIGPCSRRGFSVPRRFALRAVRSYRTFSPLPSRCRE